MPESTTRTMQVEVFPASAMARELVVIDLSSIAYPIWHTSQANPDPNHASQQIVARVVALANGHPHVAVCCDSGRSFRHELSPSYKATRPEHDASLKHQIALACEQLAADGFPVWSAKGFEADDVIASAVALIIGSGSPTDVTALVVSADKDLLQLVGPRVLAMNANSGDRLDADAVKVKLGVRPDQVRDYLTLAGDASDNVKGAERIGPKTAADLLTRFDTIEGVYHALTTQGTEFKPAVATSLREFWPRVDAVRALVTLRMDVPIPFEEISKPRVSRAAAEFAPEFDVDADDADLVTPTATSGPVAVPNPAPAAEPNAPAQTLELVTLAPADYERQLDPRSMKDARILAKDMHDSRMFSAYGSPQAVLSTVMVGRELGLPAMASLRGIHNIEGRHALSAQLMVALILKSGLAEYFDPVEFDETHATYETLRKGSRKPITLTHTIDMARIAGLVKDKSNWVKVPTDMLVARAQSRLARMVYPDIVGGLYTPDELAEIREAVA